MSHGTGTQGALRLYCDITEYLDQLDEPSEINEKIPSIGTIGRPPFSPVLATKGLLAKFGDNFLEDCNLTSVMCATDILKILTNIRSGQINDARTLLANINEPYLNLKHNTNLNGKFFDLLYGALQLICAATYGDKEDLPSANEDFVVLCGILSMFAEARQPGLMDHLDHFKVHAAVFLAAFSANQHWVDLVESAEDQMDTWGDPPPPAAVLLHAAHNLGLRADGMPESDEAYEIVKFLRKGARLNGSDRTSAAFEELNTKVGWNHAAPLLKILWPQEYYNYYRYTQRMLLDIECEQKRVETARRVGFVSEDGESLLRINSEQSPVARPATLSFPGGSAIGKTSILCKIAGKRILLDCGCDMFGRTGFWSPDFDLLDAVFITHAHQDHIGGLLKLYKDFGYNGAWYAPYETQPMVDLSLRDSVKLRKAKFKGFLAAYEEEDVDRIMDHYRPLEFGKSIVLNEYVEVTPYYAGHVHGSAQYVISDGLHHLLYTGDINTQQCFSCPPLELPPADICAKITAVITEGTYAFKQEGIIDRNAARSTLLELVNGAPKKPILIPTLSLGRAQEIIACLKGAGLKVGVFGMAQDMTRMAQMDVGEWVVLDPRPPQDVRAMEYDVLVASAGCLQGGPSKVFFERRDLQPLTTILTGYLFPGTPAREMADDLDRVRFSAHSPHEQWEGYLSSFPNALKFLIHYPGLREWMTRDDMVIPRINRIYPVAPSP